MSQYEKFIFESYGFDPSTGIASFSYSFDGQLSFTEQVVFEIPDAGYDEDVLDRALFLAFLVAGTSYYKCFPTKDYLFTHHEINASQADFLNAVYHEGMGQFIYENGLMLDGIVNFSPSKAVQPDIHNDSYEGKGLLVMQSGGKDSLLLATLLENANKDYSAWYISSTDGYPALLDQLKGAPPRVVRRKIDHEGLKLAAEKGGIDGHVPVTYIVASYSLIDLVLHRENIVLMAIGNEGAEAHAYVGDLPVNHQWAKTWEAEQLLQSYVTQNLSKNIFIGSPLRQLSELRIAELFSRLAWSKYGHSFSSCNLANYKQGAGNKVLAWDGDCPKCANSYLLFAPFVAPEELRSLFGGQDLLKKPSLQEDFKGILGIGGVIKPFECVGEIDELRLAYHMAREQFGAETYTLEFDVPESTFDYMAHAHAQDWATKLINVDI